MIVLSNEVVIPKTKLSFFLKNITTLIKLKRSNRKSIEKFIKTNKYLDAPIIPSFEGTGGPMEEGMIYIMFNSENNSSPSSIDSVFRIFWVNAPILRFSFFDSFFISEKFKSGQWSRDYPHSIFQNLSKDRFHQEVSIDECHILMDGTWNKGYEFKFSDNLNNISGQLIFDPIEKGVLTYFNGRKAIVRSMAQKFYDMFAIRINGEIEVQGKKIQVKDARAIIEHGLGIFSGFYIYDWRWLNLQFPDGVFHLFYNSITLEDIGEGILESGEGAGVMNGQWFHFQPKTFKIDEIAYEEDENLPTKVPVEWRVTAGKDSNGNSMLDLRMKKTAHLSWIGANSEIEEYVTNYIVQVEGTWEGKHIKGKGTMENMMHHKIE